MDANKEGPGGFHDMPQLAGALESNRFKRFLDHLPFVVVVSELEPAERITYANPELERLTGLAPAAVVGKAWDALPPGVVPDGGVTLSDAIVSGTDYLGVFSFADGERVVDAWSNIIEAEDGTPVFRLVALSKTDARTPEAADADDRVREKDVQLRELQHRVKNNLQMITTLIRLEARNVADNATGDRFDRLAGRVGSLAILYDALSADGGSTDTVDLGVYLSQIATAVMQAHAVEGIRLDLTVDAWPVSINVAMPTGLVVNELITNSLKHAFAGREGGTVFLHSLVDEQECRVMVGDDGNGFADGVTWPQKGKLGAMIVESLKINAKARIAVESNKNKGVRVTIAFARPDAPNRAH